MVITDHSSLKWLMSQRDLSGRLVRWSLKLHSFDFIIEYRKGTDNIVPDALSRSHGVDEISVLGISQDDVFSPPYIEMNSSVFTCSDYLDLIETITKGHLILFYLIYDFNMREKDGKVYIKMSGSDQSLDDGTPIWKLVVPQPLVADLIRKTHCSATSAHMGIAKTFELLKR